MSALRWSEEQLEAHIKRVAEATRRGQVRTHRIQDERDISEDPDTHADGTARSHGKRGRRRDPEIQKQIDAALAAGLVKPKPGRRGPSELELAFAKQISDHRLPNPLREFQFMTSRDWRMDYAWPDFKLAVEVQGMVHRIKKRFLADVEKLAYAQMHGWTVLLIAGQDIRSPRGVMWLQTLLEQRGWKK